MAKHSREEWREPRQPRAENAEALTLLQLLAGPQPRTAMRREAEARRL
jgi:hypothetical protein